MRDEREQAPGRRSAATTTQSFALEPRIGKSTLVEREGHGLARGSGAVATGAPGWEPISPDEWHGLPSGELPHVDLRGASSGLHLRGGQAGSNATASATKGRGTPGAHKVDSSFEAQLLAALTEGDVPVAEFTNLLMSADESDVRVLSTRLMATPPLAGDKLARAFYQTLPEADRQHILRRLSEMTKAYADQRLWAQLAPGETVTEMQMVSRVDASDGVHLRTKPFGAKDGPVLPFDTLVAVSRKTSRGWYYVTVVGAPQEGSAPIGASGFVEGYHVAAKMPEPTAHLREVKPGELLKDIAAAHYKHAFSWGHDARVYVQAIYHANKDRDVVFRQQADLTVNRKALDTDSLTEALELWKEARVVAGQALWMPSGDFVRQLKASGAIHQASITKTVWDSTAGQLGQLVDFLQYAGGFAVGLLEGSWGALEDLFTGVVDLIKVLWSAIKAIFGDFSEIKELAKKISDAWQKRDAILQELGSQFMGKWESPNDWDRGNYQGEVLGYVMTLALITLVTLGSGAAIAGAGRFGDFIKLIRFADKIGSIGTYTSKLASKIKLPKKAVDQSREVLSSKLAKTDLSGGNSSKGREATASSEPPAPPHLEQSGSSSATKSELSSDKPRSDTPSRELGLRAETVEALESFENIKANPIGVVNSQPNKNHYSAARREAAGTVIARRSDGRPFSHIRDLQESYNGLEGIRRALAKEIAHPSPAMTERGLEVLLTKHSEVQQTISRLKGFLDGIGHGPPFPPFHEWPPGS